MKKIKNARFIRSVEKNGKTIAEVEFAMEDGFVASLSDQIDQGRYVAILEREGNEAYTLSKVMKNEANYELDWYDNPEHQAYADVTEALFASEVEANDKQAFVQEVLNLGDVSKDMDTGYDTFK
jgi:hypothetical protein